MRVLAPPARSRSNDLLKCKNKISFCQGRGYPKSSEMLFRLFLCSFCEEIYYGEISKNLSGKIISQKSGVGGVFSLFLSIMLKFLLLKTILKKDTSLNGFY